MSQLSQTFKVTAIHTAEHLGSGDLPVLGTPALVAFIEQTCKELIAPQLAKGETTVGSFISLEHRRPTKLGATVTVVVTLTEQTKQPFVYQVTAYEAELLIAQGEHHRVQVNSDAFMTRLEK